MCLNRPLVSRLPNTALQTRFITHRQAAVEWPLHQPPLLDNLFLLVVINAVQLLRISFVICLQSAA